MASETEALREALASAPADRIHVATIELRHATFDQPVRVVQDDQDWALPLEATAPLNPGETVTFVALSFALELPDINRDAPGSVKLRLDNVSRTIGEALSGARTSQYPVGATLRYYVLDLSADPPGPVSSGPDMAPRNFEVGDVTISDRTAIGTCYAPDFASILVSADKYTRARFPGLVS
ncbi:MAG: DUF1833 family protein [Rhodocyclaceae bacterium]|nr:DUF1833 family protein [Rhodocyclaceae bacterium]